MATYYLPWLPLPIADHYTWRLYICSLVFFQKHTLRSMAHMCGHSTLQKFYTPLSTLHTTPYTLHNTHYTLHTTHYTLHTAHCTVHTPHYTIHTTQYTVHTTHYTPHTAHCTLHTTHHTPHTTHHTLHTTHHTLHITRYTLHTTISRHIIFMLSFTILGVSPPVLFRVTSFSLQITSCFHVEFTYLHTIAVQKMTFRIFTQLTAPHYTMSLHLLFTFVLYHFRC